MALNTTSERYHYIFGNTARSLEDTSGRTELKTGRAGLESASPYPAVREAQPKVRVKTGKRRKRKAEQAMDFDWKYTVIVTAAVFCIIAAAIFYVKGTITLHNLSKQVTELSEEKTRLQGKQAALKTEIDKATNLNEIKNYAVKKLGMVYPGKDHVIYYMDDGNDYIRQYESVN